MRKSDTIIIPAITPSLNKTYSTWKNKYFAEKKLKETYNLLIQSEMNKYKIKKAGNKEKFAIVIDQVRNKLLDYDNFTGGCKVLLDCLRKKGFIYDDSPKYLKSRYQQSTLKEAKETETKTIITRIYDNS